MSADHVQMFILGSLAQEKAHGYQLLARARLWGVDEWAGFGAGSIYNALGTLEKRGLVVRAGTAQQGGYAPATVYAITDAGLTAFHELLHKTAATATARDPFDLVTAFIGLLSPEERRQLVEARLERLRRRRDEVESSREHITRHLAGGKQLDWALAIIEKADALLDVSLRAAEELVQRSAGWSAADPLPSALRRDADHVHCTGDEDGAGTHRHTAAGLDAPLEEESR